MIVGGVRWGVHVGFIEGWLCWGHVERIKWLSIKSQVRGTFWAFGRFVEGLLRDIHIQCSKEFK